MPVEKNKIKKTPEICENIKKIRKFLAVLKFNILLTFLKCIKYTDCVR